MTLMRDDADPIAVYWLRMDIVAGYAVEAVITHWAMVDDSGITVVAVRAGKRL